MLTWEEITAAESDVFVQYQIIRRNGAVTPFKLAVFPIVVPDMALIADSLAKSVRAVNGLLSGARQRLGEMNLKYASNGFFSATKVNLRNAP